MLEKNVVIEEINILANSKNISLIDATLLFCEQQEIDVELVAQFIKKDSSTKGRIQVEAEDLRVLKRTARLPI